MSKLTQKTSRLVTLEIFEADIRNMIQVYADRHTGSIPRDANLSIDISADGRAALTKITVQWAEDEQPEADVF